MFFFFFYEICCIHIARKQHNVKTKKIFAVPILNGGGKGKGRTNKKNEKEKEVKHALFLGYIFSGILDSFSIRENISVNNKQSTNIDQAKLKWYSLQKN